MCITKLTGDKHIYINGERNRILFEVKKTS
jgi:hypothetical protein